MSNEWGSAALNAHPEPEPPPTANGLQPLRRIDLVAQFSGAFDLAEGQPIGHAARVAHIAEAVAKRLGLEDEALDRLRYVALLHDAGVAARELPNGVDPTGGHLAGGAWVAGRLGLDDDVQWAIRCTHERWDGSGRPNELAMKQIPEEALLVTAAHWVADALVPSENPLRARAVLVGARPSDLAPMVGDRIAAALFEELRDDAI